MGCGTNPSEVLDGNGHIDMSYMGIGSCVVGYADREVDVTVKKAMDRDSMALARLRPIVAAQGMML